MARFKAHVRHSPACLGVHEYDIKTLLGHKIAGVTAGYARYTPQVLENAVDLLAETKGKVVKFERKVG